MHILEGVFKMKVTVCIGSSCHIKGSRPVVEQLQDLIAKENLSDKIELGGTFCMGKCQEGVCVTVDGEFFSVSQTHRHLPDIFPCRRCLCDGGWRILFCIPRNCQYIF